MHKLLCLIACLAVLLSLSTVVLAEEAASAPTTQMVASLTSAPVLTASSFEPLQAESAGETKKGGCVAGLMSCWGWGPAGFGAPLGAVNNSGYKGDVGRSILRWLWVGTIIDGVKAYQGEKAEEYAHFDGNAKPSADTAKGGVAAGLKSCCLIGIPAGQMRNSGIPVPARAWLRGVPYVCGLVELYDGYKSYGGETLAEYCGTDF